MTVAVLLMLRQVVAVPNPELADVPAQRITGFEGTPEIHDFSAVLAQTCLEEWAEGATEAPGHCTRTFKVSETMT
jgi:hypothetical protein